MRLLRFRGAVIATAAVFCAAGGRTATAQDGNPAPVGNLATSYHLVERFSTKEGRPGFVGQYQVAFRETITSENQGGYVWSVRFSERPAAIAADDRRPTDVVRLFDAEQTKFTKVNSKPDKPAPKPLDGLMVWRREIPGYMPLVISLTPNRGLEELDYTLIGMTDYISKLTFALCDDPIRIGETWRIGGAGQLALTNLPDGMDGGLTARLTEIRADPSGGGRQQAIIDVTGRVQQEMGDPATGKPVTFETSFRARMTFAFTPSPPQAAADGQMVVEGYGAIEKLALAQVRTCTDLAKPQQPWIKRELELERRFPGKDALLAIPEPPPVPTVDNSWLLMADANARYSLRHPQNFRRPARRLKSPDNLELEADSGEAFPDSVLLEFRAKGNIRPDDIFTGMKNDWKKAGITVIPGESQRLPDANWPGMAVHHMEVALSDPETPDHGPSRRYFDGYVLQFPRGETILVSATTLSNKQVEFRKVVELMIKSIKMGPPAP